MTKRTGGGGCGAGRPIIGAAPPRESFAEIMARHERQREECERKHLEWLQTPEGIEYVRKQQETEERRRKEHEEAKAEEAKREAWQKRFRNLWTTLPNIGDLFGDGSEQAVRFEEDDEGKITAQVSLRVVGEYGKSEPSRVISSGKGLRMFLISKSRNELLESEPDARHRLARNKFCYINTTKKFKIIGYSQTRKSVQAELV